MSFRSKPSTIWRALLLTVLFCFGSVAVAQTRPTGKPTAKKPSSKPTTKKVKPGIEFVDPEPEKPLTPGPKQPLRKKKKKKSGAREACYTVTVNTGITSPTGGGVAWRVGWTAGLELGYIAFGCHRFPWRFGIGVVGNVAQFHGAAKLFTRGDIMLLGRFARLLGPIYLGLRVASGIRIVKDGRFPVTDNTDTGETVKRYVHLGFNFGLEISWPVLDWLELLFAADYLLSPAETSNQNFAEHRGQPKHAFDIRLGVTFKF